MKLKMTLKKNKPTHISLVFTQLQKLIDNPAIISKLQQYQVILLGGSGLPGSLIQMAIQKKLPLYLSYGLSEMASQVATTKKITKSQKLYYAQVLKYRKVKITAKGEILVKGETLFKGYLTSRGILKPLSRGYFFTGDLGQKDTGEKISVLGRLDRRFISGGENIQPEEIEKEIMNFPGVERTRVWGEKNEEYGFRPLAYIKMKQNNGFSENNLKTFLKKNWLTLKFPTNYYPGQKI